MKSRVSAETRRSYAGRNSVKARNTPTRPEVLGRGQTAGKPDESENQNREFEGATHKLSSFIRTLEEGAGCEIIVNITPRLSARHAQSRPARSRSILHWIAPAR